LLPTDAFWLFGCVVIASDAFAFIIGSYVTVPVSVTALPSTVTVFLTTMQFFSAFSCLSLLPWVATHFVPMSTSQLLCLLGAGTAAAGGQFSITAAYSHAPAREVSIYDYAQILFSAGIGFLLFADVPDGWSFLGYVVIIGAAAGMFVYNNQRAAGLSRKDREN
jgi:drug/metabolite transporter (DMT)-like permease